MRQHQNTLDDFTRARTPRHVLLALTEEKMSLPHITTTIHTAFTFKGLIINEDEDQGVPRVQPASLHNI
ncbi:hypothetical protein AMATHDRAFT_11169 [Amanita thiersii Skay4041]|uniref:Uncharacterized protein n=1 Tax=Amanita thiersii Skay4041 TaxID=703135 RepID=A0A2A9N985_9AGAR|nr:hypothetical protein AMATHDRAFT_11169 [Amanita thiersii Skay4041]